MRTHPSRSTYLAGCRCPSCRAANAEWARIWRARRAGRPLPTHIGHGTPTAYRNYGCRCPACREAHTTAHRPYKRVWRARRRAEGKPAS